MKSLITTTNVLGPFSNIEELEDSYICDDIIIQKSIIGIVTIREWTFTQEPVDLPIPPTYQELRAAAYPDFKDYLDGIVKGDLAQQQTYIDACLAVKELYPKVIL
jgi:hypothetical protein